MPDKAVLTLRSGERVEVFPLEGETFGVDLYAALERTNGADVFLDARHADGARLRVRLGDVSTLKVVEADVIAPARIWPPKTETSGVGVPTQTLCGVGGCTWTAGHAGLRHSWG